MTLCYAYRKPASLAEQASVLVRNLAKDALAGRAPEFLVLVIEGDREQPLPQHEVNHGNDRENGAGAQHIVASDEKDIAEQKALYRP